ncbi:MAG: Lactose transport system permease protein LacF [Chloroflexi bacterium ADurb.Bin325]|nr:MAG: Lactose transport system permease protein LacF [Chloroflexi bacterium ADurb.Bin325]
MAAVPKRGKRPSGVQLAEWRDGWLFALPFLLGVLIFWLGPMLYSLFLITQNWDMLSAPKFVGLGNIRRLLEDPLVEKTLSNTAYYTFIGVPLQLLVALLLALGLNQNIRGRSIYRTIFYLPAITPAIASAVVWNQIFNVDFGVLNNILRSVGLPGVKWLFDPNIAKPAFILMSLWAIGPQMVIFLAGLQNIPAELLEAAEMDGASAWQRFWAVSLPLLSPVLFFNLVIGIIGSFQVFTNAFVMTNGGPQNSTLFMVLYVYLNGFRYFRMGYAATLAWLLFWIIMFFTFLQFRLSGRWVYYEGKL